MILLKDYRNIVQECRCNLKDYGSRFIDYMCFLRIWCIVKDCGGNVDLTNGVGKFTDCWCSCKDYITDHF